MLGSEAGQQYSEVRAVKCRVIVVIVMDVVMMVSVKKDTEQDGDGMRGEGRRGAVV